MFGRSFVLTVMMALATALFAVPAKRGVKKVLPFNGEKVEARLVGDEHVHYWLTDDGRCLSEDDGRFVEVDVNRMRTHAMKRRAAALVRQQKRVRHNAIGDFMDYKGHKKGLIILVEFANMKFSPQNDSLLFTRICNEQNFSEGHFRGSVYDYFRAQSYGQFELTFDVVGPVKMPEDYQYYGKDIGDSGDDAKPGEMVALACMAVDSMVDFSDYDWDGDGEVDQVMCIYAGRGQADGGQATTIWPHEWALSESDYGETLQLDGALIDTYAVANERSSSGVNGIGTICHEFSHCLGLPDMYDTDYKGNYGMGEWSLMDAGSYNGNSFCPSGMSSFERLTCGWVKPTELKKNVTIEEMMSLEDYPEAYLVRNEAYENEYYLMENRQKKGWDAEVPASGLLIIHVDFDRELWAANMVNTLNAVPTGEMPVNDHQRCTVVRASGGNGRSGYFDTYPYMDNDSLTNTSFPAATLYHQNVSGKRLLDKGILDIKQNSDGTMAFRFRNTPQDVVLPGATVLYESFSACSGTGGNDGLWSVNMASSKFVADNEGWDATKAYGGYKCARFGNASTVGRAVTPPFVMDSQNGVLTFMAAGWNQDGTTLTLSVEGNGSVSPATLQMTPFAWKDYTVRVSGRGPIRIAFEPEQRFMLDEVLVVEVEGSQTAISNVQTPAACKGYYTLDGRFAGTDASVLRQGVYVKVSDTDGECQKVMIR
jgi:M6 family metalloprotease-like protein